MIKIQDVTFRYPKSDKEVLSRLNLEIADGEFLCIIGHSGCGKSTLLKLIAGLDMPTSGSILTDNKTISGPSVDRSVVFQQYSLFPWMTVLQNVTFAVNKTGRFSKSEAKERAVYFLKKTGLEHVLDAWPYQLSGGMRQRTAIARTLAMDSPYLLLDEPFGALDTKIRGQLQILLQDLWKESGKTVIFVTHDLDEAMILGSRIVFIEDGRIQYEKQIDTSINCCCRQQAGRADCLALKEEMTRWFQ